MITQNDNGSYNPVVYTHDPMWQTIKGQEYLSLVYIAEKHFMEGMINLEDFSAICKYALRKTL